MKMSNLCRILLTFAALLLLIAFLERVTQPRCASAQVPQFITKELARTMMIPKVAEIWEKVDQRKGIRALQHDEPLPAGTRIKPAFSVEGKEPNLLTCLNQCWLFLIDKAPGAHFAHPVTIILLDAETGEQQVMETDWWPQIDAPNAESRQIFNTVEQRMNPDRVIFERSPILSHGSGIQPLLPPVEMTVKPCDACISWAVIVCGYDDLPDTFDEDTDGIYSVLRNLGLSDDHIFFVSPHTAHPGVDQPLSKANVKWAIDQVANQSNENDKVLFFYSSHGGVDGLTCGSEGISASELKAWLNSISYSEMTIIIEACHSGSFIGRYADGTYVEAEDDLKGSSRVVFTSASTDTSSYPDVDGPDDPNQSTDIGSETIYGYVEAFSILSADTNTNGAISFSEALQYAWDNDVTRIRGNNQPQWAVYPGVDPDKVYPYCYPVSDPKGPYEGTCNDNKASVLLDGTSSEGPAPCGGLSYFWETDCPTASFDDPTSSTPTLQVDSVTGCLDFNVWLTAICSDGRSDICSTAVAIADKIPPVVTCPADRITECDHSTDPLSTGTATATDNCTPNPVITHSDSTSPGSCPQASLIKRTWKAGDGRLNYSTCEQTITVQDTTPPIIPSPPSDITVECNAVPTPATITPTDNCDPDPTIKFTETRVDGNCPSNYKLNRTWEAEDHCGNISTYTQIVTVQDTTSPTIENLTAIPNVLWPPNHKMVPISVGVSVSDNCDTHPVCTISSVTSSESEDGLGDGDTVPDWEITGELTLKLRAERSGTGSGRVYTIGVICSDACGNSSPGTTTVLVPHDRGK